MPTFNVAGGKQLRLKRGAVGVVTPPAPTNILPDQWTMAEAAADADTRKTHMRLYVPQRTDYQFGAYRAGYDAVTVVDGVRVGNISQLGWFTWDAGLGCYVWTSTGVNARGERVWGRIGMMPVGGTVSDRVWIVPPDEAKTFYASDNPGAAVWTWTTNTSGTIKAIIDPPNWNRRPGHGEHTINGGSSWTTFNEASSGGITEVTISGLTNNVATPAEIRWVNANGNGAAVAQDVTAQAPVVIVSPSLDVVATITGRTVTITAEASGTPTPEVDLIGLTLDGVDVTATGTGPWSYDVASGTADKVVAYIVDANNAGGTTRATGSVTVPADQTVPVDPPANTITTAPVFTVVPDPTVHGRLVFTVTGVPTYTTTMWTRITIAGGATTDVQVGAASTGTFNVDLSARAGNRAVVTMFARNALGDGPTGSSPQMWIPSTPSVTARIKPDTLYPGDTAILTLGTWGFPHPETTGFALTLDGAPVTMTGLGNVRTFTVPNDAAGKTLALSGAVQSSLGSGSNSTTKVISAAVSWKTPVNIANRAALDTALTTATGGEVFRLADGDYGDFTWPLNLTVPVRITSQNSRMATFVALRLSGSARGGMWVDDVSTARIAYGSNAKNARVQNCLVTGRVDLDLSNFVYTDNEHQFGGTDYGVTLSDQSGSYYARNSYFDAGADQFRAAGGIVDCVFERQTHTRISDYAKVAHPDCMQIFGQSGLRVPTRIAVRYIRTYDVNGAQGIFMTDSRSVMGYCDCSVHDNMIRAAYTNKLNVAQLSRGSIVTRNSTRGQLVTNGAYGGRVWNNLCSLYTARTPEFPTIVGDNYQYGQFTDADTIYTGPCASYSDFIPLSGAGISEKYGATTFARIEAGTSVFAVTPPVISGPKYVGQTLTATPGVYGAAQDVTGQWRADGTNISGATGLSYVIQSGDVGKTITYRDTATGISSSSASQTSNGLGAIVATPPAPPSYTFIGDAAIGNASVSGASKTFDFWPSGGADNTKQHIFMAVVDQTNAGTRTPTATPLVWVDSSSVVGTTLTQDAVYSATPGGLRKYLTGGHGIPASNIRYARVQMTGSSAWQSWAGAALIRIDSATDTWLGASSPFQATAGTITLSLTVTPATRILAFAFGKNGAITFTGATEISNRQDSVTATTRYYTATTTSAYGGTVTISADNCNGLVLVAVSAG